MASSTLPIRMDAPRIDVICTGSAAEQGAEQGSVLRDQLNRCAGALLELEAFRLQRPWWLPMTAFVRLAERTANRTLGVALQQELPEVRTRLQAMSETSGLSLARLLLLNATEAVLSDLSKSVTTGAEPGCSAVALGPARTVAGTAMIAHNFDYLPLVQPFYVVRDERPAGKLRSLQFTAAPLAGVVDGINEAGLAVTYNYAYSTDRVPPAPTVSMRLAEALARCQTVAEAITQLVGQSRWGGGMIMLADATGACAALELTGTRHSVRSMTETGLLLHANRFFNTETRSVQIPENAVYTSKAPVQLQGRRVHQSSEARESCLLHLTNSAERFDPESVARLMADHGPDDIPSADTICMHSQYWHTTACVQLFPAERRLRIAYSPACQASYTDFRIR